MLFRSYPEKLTTRIVKDLTGLTSAKLNTIRNNNLMQFEKVENLNYPPHLKGRLSYVYYKDSLIKYAEKNNIELKNNTSTYEISKQFYTPNEVQKYISDTYNKNISIPTIYRRIRETKQIPAVKIGTSLRIPILEFKNLPLIDIFNIKTP